MATVPTRREPPAFRLVEVVAVESVNPFLVNVIFGGAELAGFDPGLPASSMRLLVPDPGEDFVIPVWNGNEFLKADDSRPTIRTLTPLRFEADELELSAAIVLHGSSPLSDWARDVKVGDQVAIAGTGRGFAVPDGITKFLLAGDESAIPAIGVVLAELPQSVAVRVILEINDSQAKVELPEHTGADISWHVRSEGAAPGSAMHAAIVDDPPDRDHHVWAAGEASAVHRLRSYLFDDLGLERSNATVRGYWKLPRS
jgi:NADPH-dependent ferric siderophore reductase